MHVFALMLLSLLMPVRGWYAPSQPVQIEIKDKAQVRLVLTDFAGQRIEPSNDTDAVIQGPATIDLFKIFPADTPGAYILYTVNAGEQGQQGDNKAILTGRSAPSDFLGTPLVINVLRDQRGGAPNEAMVIRVEPLRYAVMKTDQGEMTLAFYYDAAPHTVDNFLTLAEQGFYNGLTFHRIVPQFVIQGGDPLGNGTGGPGYRITAEFNDRPHLPGVLSMARNGDPLEQQPPYPLPRAQFANTAGSQFFICLDYDNTKALDGRYTAFGRVVAGMEAVQKIAASPLADTGAGRPAKPPVIQEIRVVPVSAKDNPYAQLRETSTAMPATTQP